MWYRDRLAAGEARSAVGMIERRCKITIGARLKLTNALMARSRAEADWHLAVA